MADEKALLDRIAALEALLLAQIEKTGNIKPTVTDPGQPPRFTVVTATRNRAALLPTAIQSLLAQTLNAWEMIIIDDGSTDDTETVVAPFLSDPRLRYEKRMAQGHSAARNYGLSLAQAELIAYLDSDNQFFPNFLAGMAAAFDAKPGLQCAYGILTATKPVYEGSRILWQRFDRERLRDSNFIDLGAFVHRRTLIDTLGGFDEELTRLSDWDLILRYTEQNEPARVAEPALHYNTHSESRVTDTADLGSNWFKVKRKLLRPILRRIKVLFALPYYPQLTETYVETEIRALKRAGIDIEVWSEEGPEVETEIIVPTHRGSFVEAIQSAGPDMVYIHRLNFHKFADLARAFNIPVTIRAHGFENSREVLAATLKHRNIKQIFTHPFDDLFGTPADRPIQRVATPFDTTLFGPSAEKDRRMVLRTSAGLRSKELEFFLELGKLLPDHRLVLVASRCRDAVEQLDWLIERHKTSGSPVELRLNVPREEVAELMAEAAIYVHTAVHPDGEFGTMIGMPISIAEAMATGAYVLVRNLPALTRYVGEAGATYNDLEDAARLIAESAAWSPAEWRRCEIAAIDRAFRYHADDLVMRPLIDTWCTIIDEYPRPQGFVDSIEATGITGWVWNQTKPHLSLEVSVLQNGVIVQTAMADQFREDLLKAGKGDGRHAFRISLPAYSKLEDETVVCRVADLDYDIPTAKSK